MRTFLFFLFIAFGLMQINAQVPPVVMQDRPMLTDSAATLIGLSPDQLQGWRELGEVYQKEYDQLKASDAEDDDMRAWWKRRDAALREFLSPEQYGKWIKLDKNVQGRLVPLSKGQVHG